MSRVIKFRVWDTKGNAYQQTGEELFGSQYGLRESYGDHVIKYRVNVQMLATPTQRDLYDRNRFVLEQFIGLLDKVGREIYEGDIVRCHRLRHPERKHASIDFSIVPWPEDCWYDCVEVGEIAYSDVWLSFVEDYHRIRYDDIWRLEGGTEHRYEVIGNIHQNPELLSAP